MKAIVTLEYNPPFTFNNGMAVVVRSWTLTINNYSEIIRDYREAKRLFFKAYSHFN